MKTLSTIIQKLVIALLIGVFCNACDSGSDSGSGSELETIFIGIFDNEWEVEGVDDHFIGIFRAEGSEDTSSGVLRGYEEHPEHGSHDMINGTFDGLDIEFTIPRIIEEETKNIVFSGKMTPVSETDHNIVRMDLTTSDNETLVLKRDLQD